MTYSVKEIFYTLQGEGANAGRPAVFCRFAGCNLWSGKERHRHKAICQFCDTDFVGTDGPGGGKFDSAQALAKVIASKWPANGRGSPLVICTGGEPLLQLDAELVDAIHVEGVQIAVETNGTQPPPSGIDWLCVSPKAGTSLVVTSGDELKLVYPQIGAPPEKYSSLAFDHFFLQPLDGPDAAVNRRLAVEFCLENPRWRLSLQIHKILAIP